MLKKIHKLIASNLFLVLIAGLFFSAIPTAQASSALSFAYHDQAFTAPVTLDIKEMTGADNLPWEWETLTPAYQYKFLTTGLYDPSRPLTIKIDYGQKNNDFKQIFSYDSLAMAWRPLLTHDNPAGHYVTATTDSISGRLIVLSDPNIMATGQASWYKYKNGLFAASPDFIKGTVLRVYNLDNGKYVDVTINDYGPDRSKHPNRVIDLDKVAFAKIASVNSGLINVKIEPLKIIVPDLKKKVPQTTSSLNLTASSAIIVWEEDGSVLWGKNETKVAPLASLTKLVAMKVFLDTNPTLTQVVTYKVQDEKYNYKYCKPWESARLTVSEGETMTVNDLLYSALVGSANNAVESLVRASGLRRDEFIAQMNQVVKDWGATSTHFVEPTGLSPENVSSPYDYAIITREIFKNPLLKKISTTATYSFETINTKKSHNLKNTNKMLVNTTYDIIGSKTGYLDEAGHCLMTRVSTSNGNLIAINFGSTSSAANFLDNEQLIRYGLKLLKK